MLAEQKPYTKTAIDYKINRDMHLEKVKTPRKSAWVMNTYKLCPTTHVPIYVDHQVIKEPLAPPYNP